MAQRARTNQRHPQTTKLSGANQQASFESLITNQLLFFLNLCMNTKRASSLPSRRISFEIPRAIIFQMLCYQFHYENIWRKTLKYPKEQDILTSKVVIILRSSSKLFCR